MSIQPRRQLSSLAHRNTQEKPQVDVEVEEEDGDGPGSTQKLNLELFIKELPADLREVYREPLEEWGDCGGRIRFSNKRLFWEMEIEGSVRKFVVAAPHQVTILNRKVFQRDFPEQPLSLFDEYLESLGESTAAVNYARSEKYIIRYNLLNAGDVAAILKSAVWLAQAIRASMT